jgi:serine palmitoyltransferase
MLAISLDISLRQMCYETSTFILQHLDHPYHFVIEAFLIVFIFYIFFQRSYKEKTNRDTLTPGEIEALIEEWQPEPLVAKKQADPRVIDVDHVQVKKRYVIDSMLDREIDLKVIPVNYNKSKNEKEVKIKALNMTTVGFLGAQSHPEILKKSEEAIRRYGPGSCGPRGFYGTIDVHIELEKKLAGFMGFEEAVLFGSGFATISSVIPAFSKQPDYLLVDKACNYAIQTGVNLSRSEVRWFNHNDIKDLERILQSLKDVFVKKQQKVFVVVEALYGHSGDLAPLKELIALKVRDVARSTIVRVL